MRAALIGCGLAALASSAQATDMWLAGYRTDNKPLAFYVDKDTINPVAGGRVRVVTHYVLGDPGTSDVPKPYFLDKLLIEVDCKAATYQHIAEEVSDSRGRLVDHVDHTGETDFYTPDSPMAAVAGFACGTMPISKFTQLRPDSSPVKDAGFIFQMEALSK